MVGFAGMMDGGLGVPKILTVVYMATSRHNVRCRTDLLGGPQIDIPDDVQR